jgi:hypothetical protein
MRNLAALVGLLICLFMLWSLACDDRRRWGRQQTARGKIVDFHTSYENDSKSNTYAAVVRFETETGPIEFIDDVWGSWQPRVGRSVTVQYPIGQPKLARIPRPLLRLFFYVLLLAMAVVMVAILAGALPV